MGFGLLFGSVPQKQGNRFQIWWGIVLSGDPGFWSFATLWYCTSLFPCSHELPFLLTPKATTTLKLLKSEVSSNDRLVPKHALLGNLGLSCIYHFDHPTHPLLQSCTDWPVQNWKWKVLSWAAVSRIWPSSPHISDQVYTSNWWNSYNPYQLGAMGAMGAMSFYM